MHQIRSRTGLCLGPRWGAHDTPPDPLFGWEGDTPSAFPSSLRLRRFDSHVFGLRLGAEGASLLAFRQFFFHSLSTDDFNALCRVLLEQGII